MVKAGYKQTEIGMIPIDWSVKSLGDVCRVNQGLQIAIEQRLKQETGSSKRYITIQSINAGNNFEYIENYSSSVCCNKDDILMTRTGNTGIVVTGVNGVFHNNFFKINFDRKKIDKGYFVYSLSSNGMQKVILEKAGTSTIPDLNHKDFYSILVAIPSFEEQQAIAESLSDVDALIAGLDKLIAKKRAIKTGTMEVLLTGEKRLPGFGDDRNGRWEEVKLGNLGKTYGGITGKSKVDFGIGEARYIPFLNIMNNVTVDLNNLESVNILNSEGQNQAQKGDLFFNGSSETPEEVGMCSLLTEEVNHVYLNSFCFGFRLENDAKVFGLYLAYYFRSGIGRELIYSLAQGATRYNLSKKNFLNLTFKLPELSEQEAIAEVFADIDAEITALETRRAKTQAIKQGMMQELLTGRTRLLD